MDAPFEYVFPAIRGVQASREYYISMCPLRLIPKIFIFDEEELVPELRAQRVLNKARVPEIARYITRNRDGYIFSAITASIDAEVNFEPLASGAEGSRVGLLHIPMKARFIINDGQHRRAAIEMALRETPDLGDETIAVVLFLDIGLKRCQQMFADLNRYAVRPSRSIGVLYDHRDEPAELARLVVLSSPLFRDVVEMERSTLSMRSRKLFTLSAIYNATSSLVSGLDANQGFEDKRRLASEYWDEVAKHFPEWTLVRERKISAGEVRQDYIHSHGIVLQALGKAGSALIRDSKVPWKPKLKALKKVNWARSNTKFWEGRAMLGGRVQKADQNVTLTTNLIKKFLGLTLSPEERRVEDAYVKGRNGN
ncbi:DNA sulfur modification protein DndB [Acidicapsa dinghuensis]|uniref:DNA sulfur modification protein DndB n=1 Tax=Acidicapsa dinghuensis TaxID=2218256 RepID=A0ABW1ENQ9_9BACT|nr:DNA sulfur modification protein DndB [Acidicapsa dinghuensis]